MSKIPSYVDEKCDKVRCLDPTDPVRRGILECLADFLLARPNRKVHEIKRIEKRTKYLKY